MKEQDVKNWNIHDLGFGDGFLDMTPKAEATEEKTDKLNFIKINFCAKGIIKKVKRQLTEQEKIIANHITDGN